MLVNWGGAGPTGPPLVPAQPLTILSKGKQTSGKKAKFEKMLNNKVKIKKDENCYRIGGNVNRNINPRPVLY